MDSFEMALETMVQSYTDAEELMNFSVTMGIQDSPIVRFRLFQLRNPEYSDHYINEQIDSLFHNLGGPVDITNDSSDLDLESVRIEKEIQGAIKALLFDDEMEETARVCVEDGEWNPVLPPNQPQPGSSNDIRYNIRKKSERTYAKNKAVDRTYEIKIDERHYGQSISGIQRGLEQLFENVLNETGGNLAGNDLGRVIIQHQRLDNPIIVPLQRWDQLNAVKVIEAIMKVLNSHQELLIDQSFIIVIGLIILPKGSSKRQMTKVKGKNNLVHLKRSLVTIENKDNLCMARAIGVSWAKLNRCTVDEWKEIRKNRGERSNIDLILEHRKVPESYYKHLRNKSRNEQKKFAQALCHAVGVSTEQPLSLNDVRMFEEFLGVRVMVVSAHLGNKFITVASNDKCPCIYIYLVDDDHFHAITSITGFFSCSYFCTKCLKHYNDREGHQCEIKCIVCKSDSCLNVEPVKCSDCNMSCRSAVCYAEHKKVTTYKFGPKKGQPSGPSPCEKWWKCPTCFKVLRTDKRKKEEHRCGEYQCSSCHKYVMDDHKCYLRATPAKEYYIPKFIFFDFECSQDEMSYCVEGYVPDSKLNCKDCQLPEICKSCSKCQNCKTAWCGKATHRPNFVVAHSVCPKCIDKELKPDSVCKGCGTRCKECDNIDLHENEDPGPCPGKCGFREVIFEGADTAEKFGQWLFTDQHEYFKVVAHNMKGYDGYFILEYLIDQSIRPAKIIYNGSKIMYMTVEKNLHIKVIDSLSFLPMKLSALPKAFGLQELKKRVVPALF